MQDIRRTVKQKWYDLTTKNKNETLAKFLASFEVQQSPRTSVRDEFLVRAKDTYS